MPNTPKIPKARCGVPNCANLAASRGLCWRHIQAIRRGPPDVRQASLAAQLPSRRGGCRLGVPPALVPFAQDLRPVGELLAKLGCRVIECRAGLLVYSPAEDTFALVTEGGEIRKICVV